mmetsp:Transcript_25977/g.72525  ORF Transcript_25977/g.72525 Transcript_25977/m.72525 type:complete len:576 (+) Transcript_25977:106-1833(+)
MDIPRASFENENFEDFAFEAQEDVSLEAPNEANYQYKTLMANCMSVNEDGVDTESLREFKCHAREKFEWLTNDAPVALVRGVSMDRVRDEDFVTKDSCRTDIVPDKTPATANRRIVAEGSYGSASRYLVACSKYSLTPNGGVLLGLSLGLDMVEVDGTLTNLELVPLCAALLDAPFVRQVKLSGHPLQDTGAAVLALALPGCPWIRELELACCKITGAGVKLICEALPKSGIHRLGLRGNLLRQNASQANVGLAGAAGHAKNLISLDLQSCGLASQGMREIRQAVSERTRRGFPECRVDFEGNFMLVEVMNSVTHGACALVCVEAWRKLNSLIVRLCHFESRTAVTLYILSMLSMFIGSTLYHSMFAVTDLSWFFLMIDHCAIYFLIAGTYTPVLVMGCRDPDTMAVQKGVAVCTLIYWSMVFFGVVMEHVFAVRKPYWYSKFVLGMYVMLGFGGVPYIATCSLVQDADVIPWLELGGLTYVFGIVFFLLDKRYPAMHVVWHIFVGLGALFHFVAVWNLTTQVLKDPHRSCAPIDSELSGLGVLFSYGSPSEIMEPASAITTESPASLRAAIRQL